MNKAFDIFKSGINRTKTTFVIYDYFINTLRIPEDNVSDLLRFQIVNVVSEFDRLIHDLVLKGIVEIISNKRITTQKFKGTPIRAEVILDIIKYSDPSYVPLSASETIESVVATEMHKKLSFLSFQDFEKIKDGLSLICCENYKGQVLAKSMTILLGASLDDKEKYLKQQLSLIVSRRNQIAHEGDFDPLLNEKRDIDKNTVAHIIDFIEDLGCAIYKMVTASTCYIK